MDHGIQTCIKGLRIVIKHKICASIVATRNGNNSGTVGNHSLGGKGSYKIVCQCSCTRNRSGNKTTSTSDCDSLS